MWQKMWKILQNFLGTKQGPSHRSEKAEKGKKKEEIRLDANSAGGFHL